MVLDLTFDECERILLAEHYGHLGCVQDAEPYVIPTTYVYKYGYLFSHTTEGQKIEIMRKHPKVCLQVERVRAGNDWDSVICWGTYEEVTDHDQIREIHQLLSEQYARISTIGGKPLVSPLVTHVGDQVHEKTKHDVVYRINIQRTTGKAERPKH